MKQEAPSFSQPPNQNISLSTALCLLFLSHSLLRFYDSFPQFGSTIQTDLFLLPFSLCLKFNRPKIKPISKASSWVRSQGTSSFDLNGDMNSFYKAPKKGSLVRGVRPALGTSPFPRQPFWHFAPILCPGFPSQEISSLFPVVMPP